MLNEDEKESWEKYCNELNEEIIEKNNKIFDLEMQIEKLQKENEEKDKTIEKYIKIYKEYDCYRWVKELEKKDKQIDLMAEYIEKVTVDMKIAFGENMLWDRNQIKQYFEKLIKEKG